VDGVRVTEAVKDAESDKLDVSEPDLVTEGEGLTDCTCDGVEEAVTDAVSDTDPEQLLVSVFDCVRVPVLVEVTDPDSDAVIESDEDNDGVSVEVSLIVAVADELGDDVDDSVGVIVGDVVSVLELEPVAVELSLIDAEILADGATVDVHDDDPVKLAVAVPECVAESVAVRVLVTEGVSVAVGDGDTDGHVIR
jgi:hypothetical protein